MAAKSSVSENKDNNVEVLPSHGLAWISGRGDVAWQHRGLWSLLPGFKSLPRPHRKRFLFSVKRSSCAPNDIGDGYLTTVANQIEEACKLIADGWIYVLEMAGAILFEKRK